MRRIVPIVCLLALLAVPSAGATPRAGGPVTRGDVKRYIADVKSAIKLERDAVQQLLTHSKAGYDKAKDDLRAAGQDLLQPETFLAEQSFAGVSPVPLIKAAKKADDTGYYDLFDSMSGNNYGKLPPRSLVDKDVALITAALPQKKKALARLEEMYTTGDSGPGTYARKCEVTKEFDVYAVPQGYSGSYADVFPHGIPKNADGIQVRFIDTATGKPPAAELFPGQTWTSETKGFLPDGRFDVRVNVSGTGFGKPDANVRHWKVVVTYDC